MTQRGRRVLAREGPIHPEKIRHRDGDRCYMCGIRVEPVNSETRKRGTARSLDHVVPLSLGGEDTMFNLRVACMKCDGAKGNNPEMVDIAALLPALVDRSWLDYEPPKREPEPPKQKIPPVLYRHVKPWTPPPVPPDLKPEPKVKSKDGWWNYEPDPPRPPDSTISATRITSREELHAWWNRHNASPEEDA